MTTTLSAQPTPWFTNPIHQPLSVDEPFPDQTMNNGTLTSATVAAFSNSAETASVHANNDASSEPVDHEKGTSLVADLLANHSAEKSGVLSTALYVDRSAFLVGDEITGTLEVTSKLAKALMLGKVEITVWGMEEIMQKSEVNRRLFLHHTVTLQGTNLGPSDAVIAGPSDSDGYWVARRGKTVFKFRVEIPSEANVQGTEKEERSVDALTNKENIKKMLPSSFWTRQFGGIRYFITGTVFYKHKSKIATPLRSIREVQVVEWAAPRVRLVNDFAASHSMEAMHRVVGETQKKIKNGLFGKKGDVILKAQVHVPSVEEGSHDLMGAWTAGGVGFIGVQIRNESKKKVKNLSISLIRRLKTFQVNENGQVAPVNFHRSVMSTKTYRAQPPSLKTKAITSLKHAHMAFWSEEKVAAANAVDMEFWDGIEPETERHIILDMPVPFNARTVNNATLIDVSYCIRIATDFEINLELPVTIYNPLSLKRTLTPFEITRIMNAPSRADLTLMMNRSYTPNVTASQATVAESDSVTMSRSLSESRSGTLNTRPPRPPSTRPAPMLSENDLSMPPRPQSSASISINLPKVANMNPNDSIRRRTSASEKVSTIRRKRSLAIDSLIERIKQEEEAYMEETLQQQQQHQRDYSEYDDAIVSNGKVYENGYGRSLQVAGSHATVYEQEAMLETA